MLLEYLVKEEDVRDNLECFYGFCSLLHLLGRGYIMNKPPIIIIKIV